MMMEKGKGEKKSRGKEEARQKWGKGIMGNDGGVTVMAYLCFLIF